MRHRQKLLTVLVACVTAFATAASALAAEVQVALPLGRTAYQTNEWIHVAVVRSAAEALKASELSLALTGADGGRMVFAFPVPEVPLRGADARATEHVYLNGRLLRPGSYTLEVSCDGAKATSQFDVFSYVRKSSFKLIDWGSRANGKELELLGENGMGFNVIYGQYRVNNALANAEATLRGGADFMQCCTMGGGHQMELRMDLDWSDPEVLSGGRLRVVQQAFITRTMPNTLGVHFYDEPGLTWRSWPDPPVKHTVVEGETYKNIANRYGIAENGLRQHNKHAPDYQLKPGDVIEIVGAVPHNIPTQVRSYEASFGRPYLQHDKVDPNNPEQVKQWTDWGHWKLSFMEASWKYSDFGVKYVNPNLLTCTQSQYGWCAYADGYYFNIARPLSVISGHGGYDDFGLLYFNPSWFLEIARARDHTKDNWYLPAWYGSTPSDRFKMEQYLSFITNIQGLAKPPDIEVHKPSSTPTTPGVVASNRAMARLGTIFTTMPVTKPPVAILYSLSQNLYAQTRDMTDNYAGGKQRENVGWVYLACKRIQQPIMTVTDEDIQDGTLTASHKAVILTGVQYLAPAVLNALEAFAANGGLVLLTGDCTVQVKGAVNLKVVPAHIFAEQLKPLIEKGDWGAYGRIDTMGSQFKSAEPLAKAIKAQLDKAGIRPPLECDEPGIVAERQAFGDIEYLFAVNASYDDARGGRYSLRPAATTISLPDGRPVYDALLGGKVEGLKTAGQKLTGTFRFGTGEMRAFARTARPIGGVRAHAPVVTVDYTRADLPVRVDVGATLLDTEGRVLTGSAPLRIMVRDAFGATRFDLYRATKDGTFGISLPLAANDAKGEWRVTVQELLANTKDTASFTYAPAAQCGAAAGIWRRAVYFGPDRDNVFRFFRVHQDVTIVSGASDFNAAAAQRLAEALKPWGVRCKMVNAADVNKPRSLTEQEAPTWVGLTHTSKGTVLPGDKNRPDQVGFAVQGPVILLGSPDDNPAIKATDNPLMKAIVGWGFMPYATKADVFPGRGRGMVAWQLDAVGRGQESITLTAYDAEGMSEAVGTLYEMAAGLDPLTTYELPSSNSVTLAAQALLAAETPALWDATLPDGAAALKALPKGRAAALSRDGSLSLLSGDGKIAWQKPLAGGGEDWAFDASADGEVIAAGASLRVVAFNSQGKQLFDEPVMEGKNARTVTCVAVSGDGGLVAAGADDGRLTLFTSKGKRLWTVGGVDPNDPKAVARPYLSGIFSADGKSLVALTAGEAHVIDTKDGKTLAKVAGVSGTVAPVLAADGLLVTDGRTRVALLSAAEGKLVKEAAMPVDGTVALAATPAGVVVGTGPDNTVRMLKALEGKAQDNTVWAHTQRGFVVKQLAAGGDLIAVSYWGGRLAVLDAAGKVVAARQFEQDITGLAWLDGKLVVASADGRLTAVEAKAR